MQGRLRTERRSRKVRTYAAGLFGGCGWLVGARLASFLSDPDDPVSSPFLALSSRLCGAVFQPRESQKVILAQHLYQYGIS